ncbi:hypothetical protein CDAR_36141 [Caerostris darwini]|uniref:Uncharacterized protein n=1 Tax=Caerostris darwini TaxID=1538125 RepID=A0AAV4VCR3_9ARAC|nr:hypothetical protein CDAR_36141 [Caerostris darwini]
MFFFFPGSSSFSPLAADGDNDDGGCDGYALLTLIIQWMAEPRLAANSPLLSCSLTQLHRLSASDFYNLSAHSAYCAFYPKRTAGKTLVSTKQNLEPNPRKLKKQGLPPSQEPLKHLHRARRSKQTKPTTREELCREKKARDEEPAFLLLQPRLVESKPSGGMVRC